MRTFSKISILSILQFLFCVPMLFAQNIVLNGSFTNTGTSWTFFAPATGTEAYNPETSYGGTVGTNTIAEIDNGANLRQAGIAVVPGAVYNLSFRYTRRTLGGAPNPTAINVKVYNGTTSFLTQNITASNTTWGWQCATLQFTPTTNTVTLDFENATATTSTLGTILDDITITPAEQVITFTGTSCQGGNFTLQAPLSSGPDQVYTNYSWTGPNGFTSTSSNVSFTNIQPALSGTYTCTMTLNGCLTVSGTYQLLVTPSIINITKDICLGESYDFYGRSLFQSGVYDTLIVSNNNTCDSQIILQLNVNPLPDVSLEPNTTIRLCAGDTAVLKVKQAGNAINYQWQKSGLNLNGATNYIYETTQAGSYSLVATTNKGCTATSDPIDVLFYALPDASFTISPSQGLCVNDTITLTGAAGATIYAWSPESNFRQLGDFNSQITQMVIPKTQTSVTLAAYNEIGCEVKDSLLINANACCYMSMPNAFSPNGDGLNEVFEPVFKTKQVVLSFIIVDRWGNIAYRYSGGGLTPKWNGTYPNGKAAISGVFMYFIRYNCNDNTIFEKKGDVLLIR